MKSSSKHTYTLGQRLGLALVIPAALLGAIATPLNLRTQAQTPDGRAMTVRSDRQQADQQTGVVTAIGNVRIDYPARQIQATAAQAQYFSRERRLVLTGNVYILQQGNSIRGERVTYLVDEGRFVAEPKDNRQVESVYLISDPQAPAEPPPAPAVPPVNPKPAFKTPVSEPAPEN